MEASWKIKGLNSDEEPCVNGKKLRGLKRRA